MHVIRALLRQSLPQRILQACLGWMGIVLLSMQAGASDPILTPERILSFKSDIRVQPDASLLITENITVTATGERIKNGLIREFPIRSLSAEQGRLQTDFEITQALCNGQPEPYRLERTPERLSVILGRKDVQLSPGVYVYTLSYRAEGQMGFFTQYDEVYWNVTGNHWAFRIEKAAARIELPFGAKLLQSSAFTGAYGARDSNYSLTFDEQLQPIFTTSRPLHPGEGFSVAAAWPKGFVRQPTAWDLRRRLWLSRKNLIFWLLGLVVLFTFSFYVFMEFRSRRNRKN